MTEELKSESILSDIGTNDELPDISYATASKGADKSIQQPQKKQEHRAFNRVVVRRPARVLLPNQEIIKIDLSDISVGGMAGMCERSLVEGTKLQMAFKLHHHEEMQENPVHLIAQVVYSAFIGAKGAYRVGVKFLHYKDNSRHIIEEFVANRIALQGALPEY